MEYLHGKNYNPIAFLGKELTILGGNKQKIKKKRENEPLASELTPAARIV